MAILGPLLLAAVVVLRWLGRELGRGVAPGLTAGIAPLVIPAFTMNCVRACSTSCPPDGTSWCQMACLAAGVVAGGFVAMRGAHFGPGRVRFLISAIAVAGATGALGCLLGGMLGVTGMAAGLVLGVVPVLILVPRPA